MTKLNSPLRQRTIDDMTFRNMPPNSEKVHIYAVANLGAFDHRSPDKLGIEHALYPPRNRCEITQTGIFAMDQIECPDSARCVARWIRCATPPG
jgi:hypothetical protein